MGTKDGEILVKEYYNIAPTIVKRIDRSPDASEIYADIWEKYLKPCVRLIEAGEQEECREIVHKDGSFSGEEIFVFSRRREK